MNKIQQTLTARVTGLEGAVADLAAGQARTEALLIRLVEGVSAKQVTPALTEAPVVGEVLSVTDSKPRKAPVAGRNEGKNALAVGDLGRKGWNNTFSALVRTSGLRNEAGVSLYRVSQERWTEVAAMRNEGVTPFAAMNVIQGYGTWVKAPKKA